MAVRDPDRVEVAVGGRRLSLSNLDKVLYPDVGYTKSQVINYYARIADVMLPHISERCLTLRRWPNGVDQQSFFEKRCPGHRPDWVPVGLGPGDHKGGIEYCRVEDTATMAWAGNLAAIELHSPMAFADDLETPRTLVFDFDPGPHTSVVECCQIALATQTILDAVSLRGWCKTSGSKGLQMYVPLNDDAATHQAAADFALACGQVLERQMSERVTTVMAKVARPGKIFVDWSQNAHHKTTIAPYSLRARSRPTVSTPVTWDEVESCASGDDPLVFEAPDVLTRIDEHGDLFAEVLSVQQELPAPRK